MFLITKRFQRFLTTHFKIADQKYMMLFIKIFKREPKKLVEKITHVQLFSHTDHTLFQKFLQAISLLL